MKSKYDKLLRLTAEALEVIIELVPLLETGGTVSRALKTEPRLWELLSDNTIERLGLVYGMKAPDASLRTAEGEANSE